MTLVYLAAWFTGTPKMLCLLDIVPKNPKGHVYSLKVNPLLAYEKDAFYKYAKPYKIVNRAEFEALHGRIQYP